MIKTSVSKFNLLFHSPKTSVNPVGVSTMAPVTSPAKHARLGPMQV